MAPGRFSSGAALALFETLDSTSSEAKRRAEAGARGPLWIVALEQTSGYGRRGAHWRHAAGDFAGTFLFEPKASTETLGQISFIAALAVAEALEASAPQIPLALKWPNDVLADGGKIAGLLLELLSAPGRAESLIALGVGVNIVSKPEIADYPAARLVDFLENAPAPPPAEFAVRLDAAIQRWLERWRKEGFAPVRAAWLERAFRLGQTIRVRLADGDAEGVFADLDSQGALVLDCEEGRRLVTAGAIQR